MFKSHQIVMSEWFDIDNLMNNLILRIFREIVENLSLGPEMKSTGECLGIDKTFNGALYKAFIGAGIELPKHKQMIMSIKEMNQVTKL